MSWDDTKVENGGVTAAGKLSASEYNAMVTYILSGGSGSPAPLRWGYEGVLATGNIFRHEIRESCTIDEVYASVATAPDGSALQVQVYKISDASGNPSTTDSIFSSDTPLSISSGSYSATGTLDSGRTSCSAGDVIIVGVTQVGSSTEGEDLYVVVSFE